MDNYVLLLKCIAALGLYVLAYFLIIYCFSYSIQIYAEKTDKKRRFKLNLGASESEKE